MSTALPKEPLRAIFADLSGLPASRVLWSGEPKGFAGVTDAGKSGHLILKLTATRRIGVDEELHEYEVEALPDVFVTRVTLSGFRVRTITVKAENYDGEEGFDLLEEMRLALGSDDVCALLNAAGLSLNGDEGVVGIDASAGERTVKFAALDVLFNQSVSKVTDRDAEATGDTFIESLEIEEAKYES